MNKITQTIKPLFLFFTLATLLQVQAQQYVNGPLSTGAISNSGVAAPPGTTWSELQNDAGNLTVTNTEEGFWIGNVFRNKLADDFVVPAGQLWDIHNFEFYVYKTDITFTTLPVTSLGIEIW